MDLAELTRIAQLAAAMTGMNYPAEAALPRLIDMSTLPPAMQESFNSRSYNHAVDTSGPYGLFYGGTIIHTPDLPDPIMAHEMTHWLQKHAGYDFRHHYAEKQADCVRDLFGTEPGNKPGICGNFPLSTR